MRTRALETYWAGFTTWWIGQLERRWRRSDLGDRLARTALDVGTALVADRHGPSDVRVALDQLAWLVDVSVRTKFLTADEEHRVTTAIGVVRGMCAPDRPAPLIGAVRTAPTPA